MTDYAVIVVGAGPTGLMLAAELRLAGVDVIIVEKRSQRERTQPGALGLHARIIDIFDQRGIADRFLSAGKPAQVIGFAGVKLDISAFPTRHPYGLALAQKHSDRILLDWAEELGVPILRGVGVSDFNEDETGVAVTLDDGRVLRSRFVVGCDGGRSFVRKHAGIGFPGFDPTISHLLAEAELAIQPPYGLGRDEIGTHAFSPAENGKVGIVVTEKAIGTGEPSLETLREALIAHHGTDYGVHNPTYISRFTDMTRQAERYRKGRVLLAGDAAHIHYPAGGFGMGIGIEDAFNLGWKLALVAKGAAPDALLDTYQVERHPVAAKLLRYTMASAALSRTDDRSKALSAVVADLMGMDGSAQAIAGEMSGLTTRYDLGNDHPMVGRAMPDLDLSTGGSAVRVAELLRDAHPLLLNFGVLDRCEANRWEEKIKVAEVRYDGEWCLPVTGSIGAPRAVLVRPDGCVAWVYDGSFDGLTETIAHWFRRT